MQLLRYIFWILAALSGLGGWLMKQAELGELWRLPVALAAVALLTLAVWTAYDLRRRPREPGE